MATMLMKETKTWKIDSEDDAIGLIEDFRAKQNTESYTLTKGSYTMKTRKSKGEIIDSWYETTVTLSYNI